jgi:hypothetical protein
LGKYLDEIKQALLASKSAMGNFISKFYGISRNHHLLEKREQESAPMEKFTKKSIFALFAAHFFAPVALQNRQKNSCFSLKNFLYCVTRFFTKIILLK